MDILVENQISNIPIELLLLADPSEKNIRKYLNCCTAIIAKDASRIVGVLIMIYTGNRKMEIMNIAVEEAYQRKKIGKQLLLYAIEYAEKNKIRILEIGTGNSSLVPMLLYQKCGFRITGIKPDFYRKHYTEKIFENGIECRDMIRLKMKI